MGVKYSQMFIQIKTPRRLEIIARWGPLPISMVLRSEGSLKSVMLSLARTSKCVNNTSVLKQQLRGRQLGLTKLDSDRFIFMLSYRTVMSNKNIYAI